MNADHFQKQTATSEFLGKCLKEVVRIAGGVPIANLANNRIALDFYKQTAIQMIQALLRCSDDEVTEIISGVWPSEFSVLKTALLSGVSDDRRKMMDTVKSLYESGPQNPGFSRHLLLAMVLFPSRHVNSDFPWDSVPRNILKTFINYQLDAVPLVVEGDGEMYGRHLERTLDRFLSFISSPATPQELRDLAIECYMKNSGRMYVEMTDYNARRIAELRCGILRHIFGEVHGWELDWTPPPRESGGKIRMGVIAKTIMAGVETIAMLNNLSRLDREKYHVILFCFNMDGGYYHDIEYYRELVSAVDEIHYLSHQNVKETVSLARGFNLDIMWLQSGVGLADKGPAGVIMLHRMARTQCLMTAMYALSSGNSHFKYFINLKPVFLPKTWEGEFSEIELNAENGIIYIPTDWRHKPNRLVTRESLEIPENAVVYISGATAAKYNAECMMTWCELLKNVPNAYLVLCPMNPGWYPDGLTIAGYYSCLQYAFSKIGDLSDRIRIVDHVNGEAVAFMHKWCDVHLSSFPYGGVTTLSDSMRDGLAPVCTVGKTSRANGDVSILELYGLQDLCLKTKEEYLRQAVRLGTDAEYLADMKNRVKQAYDARHPLIKDEIAIGYARIIDEIAEREFGIKASSQNAA